MIKLLKNAHVFAPEDAGLQHLLVGGGKILWMGERIDELPAALAVETTDLQGTIVIPGIIDGHAHLTGGGGESGFRSQVPALLPGHFTLAGVTSVVGVLGTDDTTRNTAGLLAKARGLREEGLNAWCHTGGYHVPAATLTGSVRSDIVNLGPVIGVGEVAISDHRSSQPTFNELLRIASDAHVAGLITGKAGILHLHLGDGPRGLKFVRDALDTTELPARVFNPTHVNRRQQLFAEALDVAARGCTIDITAFPVMDDEDAYSADRALLMYLDSRVPADRVTISSDGGGCLPQFNENGEIIHMDVGQARSLLETLQLLLRAGHSPDTVLPAFTSNVAKLLRFHNKGRVATGLDADLLVLNDQFDLINVMVGGLWHVREGQQIIFGQFENNPG